jgi:uncharacterized protein
MTKTTREPWVDAARALALLGVFLVNGLGYAFSPYYPLQIGPPQPIDSKWANVAGSIVIFLLQGKAWSLLSFLFGYSLCALALQSRRRNINPINRLQRRYAKLLLVGVLHGFFVYFGDILTIYGLCGLLASRWALEPRRKLLVRWKFLSKLVGVLIVLALCRGIYNFLYGFYGTPPIDIMATNRFGNLNDLQTFFELNSTSYLWQLLDSLIFFLPYVLWCCDAGILACRFRLLSASAVAKKFWQKTITPIHCAVILVLNLCLGVATFYIHQSDGYSHRIAIISMLTVSFGMALSAAFIATCMRYANQQSKIPKWAGWLAPAGRHTLSMYLSLSVLLVLCHVVLGYRNNSSLLSLGWLITAWLTAVTFATFATQKQWRDPIASWLSR